ncbi:unnamed protein product [Lactuca saligna]|uniref:Dynamin stalk domain-containing protein n=1 Tax=Lactuca saligna TaxID=75948 RepID=A0AA35ZJD3_LACSI|nr:unnamed protein product [Lactuca saligna]
MNNMNEEMLFLTVSQTPNVQQLRQDIWGFLSRSKYNVHQLKFTWSQILLAQVPMAPKQPSTGLFVGLNKGHVFTKKELEPRPSDRKGEVDPCEDLTDDDIRTAIQNATGPRYALFVPEMGYRCMVNELQRFPVLRKRMDDIIVVEVTLQQVKSSKLATTVSRQKGGVESEKAPQSERGIKSRAILSRPFNGIVTEQVLFFFI